MRSDDLRLTPVETVMRKKRRIRNVVVLVVLLVVGLLPGLQDDLLALLREHGRALQVWLHRQRDRQRSSLLGMEGLAGHVSRSSGTGRATRRSGFCTRRARPAHRCVKAQGAGHRPGVAELQRLPYRYLSRDPGRGAQLILGAPANNLRLYDFVQFLRQASLDNRFTGEVPFPDHSSADYVLEKIEEVGGDLNVRRTSRVSLHHHQPGSRGSGELREQLAFLDRQHDWGPGRVDTFNPYKVIQFSFPMDSTDRRAAERLGRLPVDLAARAAPGDAAALGR